MTRRDALQSAAAIAALHLTGTAAPAAGAAAGPLWFVHPELRALLAARGGAAPVPAMSQATLAAYRQGFSVMAAPRLPSPAIERKRVSGGGSLPEVTVYVVNARPGGARPAIVEMHGGGMVTGDAVTMIGHQQALAAALDCVVISVDYRLAPETTFEGSTQDNYSALKWVHDHAAELGVDPARIAVMGGSAGGGHAALLALLARDRGEVPLCFQCLTYPMLDDRTGSTRHLPHPVGALFWTEESNRFGWASFLGQQPGTDAVPARAVPARHEDLKGLPPTFIGVGSIDLFVAEDLAYAERLALAGIPVDVEVVPGAFHSFDIMGAATKVGRAFAERRLAALRAGLGLA